MMIPIVVRLAAALAFALWRSIVRLRRTLDRILTAQALRRELNAMPDFVLRDMGVARSDIGYVARTLAISRGGRFRR